LSEWNIFLTTYILFGFWNKNKQFSNWLLALNNLNNTLFVESTTQTLNNYAFSQNHKTLSTDCTQNPLKNNQQQDKCKTNTTSIHLFFVWAHLLSNDKNVAFNYQMCNWRGGVQSRNQMKPCSCCVLFELTTPNQSSVLMFWLKHQCNITSIFCSNNNNLVLI
jgi:hypothetical protein